MHHNFWNEPVPFSVLQLFVPRVELHLGALMKAFGMVSPVYRFESWLNATLHLCNQTAILAILFFAVLVIAPPTLLSLAAFVSRT